MHEITSNQAHAQRDEKVPHFDVIMTNLPQSRTAQWNEIKVSLENTVPACLLNPCVWRPTWVRVWQDVDSSLISLQPRRYQWGCNTNSLSVDYAIAVYVQEDLIPVWTAVNHCKLYYSRWQLLLRSLYLSLSVRELVRLVVSYIEFH